ncbi:MAG: two-component system sensor histidine kinase NtrB [Alphaproteobacteria bacterium]
MGDNKEQFKTIFNHVGVGIAQTDVGGRFICVNPPFCHLVGRSVDELLRLRMEDITHPEDVSRSRELSQKLIAGTANIVLEQRYVRPDGSRVWASNSLSVVKDAAGMPLFVLVVAEDVTRRKRSEEKLIEREEKLRQDAQELEQHLIASGRLVSLGELTASMAHEFNNPLGIVLGFTQELLGEMDPTDPKYRSLQIIDEEAKRCARIVQDLLEFTRPRSVEFVQTDVKEVIRKTLDMISSRLVKQKVKAMTQTSADLPMIHADPQQLQQLLVNLCLNSIDAMPEGGCLTIKAETETPQHLAITVTDTGFGIEAEMLQKIFQPFFTARKRKGLGLGLAVCERIVKAHGGTIETRSTPGCGASFKILLPVTSE